MTMHRPLLVLAISCIMSAGPHYAKHAFSSLGPELMSELGINRREFGLLFSAQEIPGIVLPLYAGVVVTDSTAPISAIVLTLLVLLGQVLAAISLSFKRYYLLILGRMLFGLGDGAVVVLQGVIIACWFAKKRKSDDDPSNSLLRSEDLEPRSKVIGVATAYGIMLLVSRVSTLISMPLPAYISSTCSGGVECSLFFSAGVCAVSFISGCLYAFLAREQRSQQTSSETVLRVWSAFRDLGKDYWLLVGIWMCVSSVFYTFLHFSTDMIVLNTHVSSVNAGLLGAFLVFFSAALSPFLGALLDRYGRRLETLTVSAILMLLGLLLMLVNDSKTTFLIVAVGVFGMGYALAPVSLLSGVVLVVPTASVGAALGLFKSMENVGLATVHVCAGELIDRSGQYNLTLVSFVAIVCLAIYFTMAVRRMDVRRGGLLSKPSTTRKNKSRPSEKLNEAAPEQLPTTE